MVQSTVDARSVTRGLRCRLRPAIVPRLLPSARPPKPPLKMLEAGFLPFPARAPRTFPGAEVAFPPPPAEWIWTRLGEETVGEGLVRRPPVTGPLLILQILAEALPGVGEVPVGPEAVPPVEAGVEPPPELQSLPDLRPPRHRTVGDGSVAAELPQKTVAGAGVRQLRHPLMPVPLWVGLEPHPHPVVASAQARLPHQQLPSPMAGWEATTLRTVGEAAVRPQEAPPEAWVERPAADWVERPVAEWVVELLPVAAVATAG